MTVSEMNRREFDKHREQIETKFRDIAFFFTSSGFDMILLADYGERGNQTIVKGGICNLGLECDGQVAKTKTVGDGRFYSNM